MAYKQLNHDGNITNSIQTATPIKKKEYVFKFLIIGDYGVGKYNVYLFTGVFNTKKINRIMYQDRFNYINIIIPIKSWICPVRRRNISLLFYPFILKILSSHRLIL